MSIYLSVCDNGTISEILRRGICSHFFVKDVFFSAALCC